MLYKCLISFLLFVFAINISSFPQGAAPKISYSDYINQYKEIAVQKMHEYGIPASITLAQGLLESGSGNSDLTVNANNHFGIKCHKEWTGMTYVMDDDEKGECFRKYASSEESFNDHSLFLTTRPRYASLFSLDLKDYKGWAYGLKAAGYATNPRYAEMLIKIIEENQLYLFDSGAERKPVHVEKDLSKPHGKKDDKSIEKSKLYNFDYVEVTNGNRSIYVNNGVRLIFSRQGDNAQSIADDVGVHTFQILQYNELGKEEVIKPGSIIYVEPKKRRADKDYHMVAEGESMRDISQLYAIKLKTLYKKNDMQIGHEPVPGTKLFLKKNKPVAD